MPQVREGGVQVSRLEDTKNSFKEIQIDTRGRADANEVFSVSLINIALSLAVIADKLTEGNSNDGAGSEADHS